MIGLDIARLKYGNTLLLESCHAVYEIEVLWPQQGLIRIISTDAAFKQPQLAVFDRSVSGRVSYPDWIGESLRMEIKTKTKVFQSSPILSCRVRGHDWHFDVF